MIDAMETNELKRRFQDLVELGISQEAIAEKSGVPVTSLRKFKAEDGKMGKEYCMRLERWILNSGLMRQQSDLCFLLAKELRVLADLMESDAPIELKRMRLSSLLDSYGSGRMLGAAENSPK